MVKESHKLFSRPFWRAEFKALDGRIESDRKRYEEDLVPQVTFKNGRRYELGDNLSSRK